MVMHADEIAPRQEVRGDSCMHSVRTYVIPQDSHNKDNIKWECREYFMFFFPKTRSLFGLNISST